MARTLAFVLALMTLPLMTLTAGGAWAEPALDQARIVSRAASTIERLRADPNLGPHLANAMSRARAVLIVPDLVKGGFLIGAEYGTGVLLTRSGGRWSGPAFYSVASASVGLQVGLQDAETVFVIMSDGGLSAVMDNRFKAGATASVAVRTVGAGAQAAPTTNAGADIYAFATAVGVYGGATLDGAGILPRHSWNAAYYGGSPTPEAIVLRGEIDSPQADRLRDVLSR
jgi:lipid-binding SYLF domain-containing protein